MYNYNQRLNSKTYFYMDERTKGIQIENPQYDWTKGRAINLGHGVEPEHQKYQALYLYQLEETEEEKKWWQYINIELSSHRGYAPLPYLQHPKVGRLIALYSNIEANILLREGYRSFSPGHKLDRISEKFKKIEKEKLEFTKDWSQRILSGDFPSEGQLKQPYLDTTLNDEIYYLLVQHNRPAGNFLLEHELPYVGLIPEQEATQAITSFLEQKMKELKEIDQSKS